MGVDGGHTDTLSTQKDLEMKIARLLTTVLAGAGGGGPWYLAGGVDEADCIAAYQAIGASTIFAAYTNLANPGTYDLTAGITPGFDISYGWSFNGVDQYLRSTMVPNNDQTWSVIVRFSEQSGTGDKALTGALNAAATSGLALIADKANTVSYRNGDTPSTFAPKLATGILAIAGNKAYRDGVAEAGTLGTGTGTLSQTIIGGVGYAGNAAAWFCNVKIQAIAFYHAVLTPSQVAAITTAMNALNASTPP